MWQMAGAHVSALNAFHALIRERQFGALATRLWLTRRLAATIPNPFIYLSNRVLPVHSA